MMMFIIEKKCINLKSKLRFFPQAPSLTLHAQFGLKDIYKELEKAYEITTSGCPGPVWLDIPLDVQAAPVAKRKWNIIKNQKTSLFINKLDTDIKKVMNLLKKAKRL